MRFYGLVLCALFGSTLSQSNTCDGNGIACPTTPSTTSAVTFGSTATSKTPTVIFAPGLIYNDRTYTVVSQPSFLSGASLVKLFNDDKSFIGSSYVSFNFSVPSKVYLAFDSRATVLPSWLSSSAWKPTGTKIIRTDSSANLDMNLFVTSKSVTSITLGGASAVPSANVGAQYVPYVVPGDFQCSYFSFSDSFNRPNGGPGERWQGGTTYPELQPSDPVYYTNWIVRDGQLFSNSSGYQIFGAITKESYTATTYTLETSVTGFGAQNTWRPYFVFGGLASDPYSGSLQLQYATTSFGTNPQLLIVDQAANGASTTLGAANYASSISSKHYFRITKDDFNRIQLFVSTTGTFPATPLISVASDIYPSLGYFGWAVTTEPPYTIAVDYVTACGRSCK